MKTRLFYFKLFFSICMVTFGLLSIKTVCNAYDLPDDTLFIKIEDTETVRTIAKMPYVTPKHGPAYDYLQTDGSRMLYDAIYAVSANSSLIMPKYFVWYSPIAEALPYSYKFYIDENASILDKCNYRDLVHARTAMENDYPERATLFGGLSGFCVLYCKENNKNVAYMLYERSSKGEGLDYPAIEAQTDAVATSIASKISGDSLAEKELQAHDYLAGLINYDTKGRILHDDDAYGALVEHNTRCVGYSAGLRLVLKKIGIDSLNIIGTADVGGHCWTLVKLDDGKWYEVDLTIDAGNPISHVYFNRTTYDFANRINLATSHEREEDVFPDECTNLLQVYYPKATGTKYTYAYLRPGYSDDGKKMPTSVSFTSPSLTVHPDLSDNKRVPQTIKMKVGETLTLAYQLLPEDTDPSYKDSTYYLVDGNDKAVSLSGNVITAISPGENYVRVTQMACTDRSHYMDYFLVHVVDGSSAQSNNSGSGNSNADEQKDKPADNAQTKPADTGNGPKDNDTNTDAKDEPKSNDKDKKADEPKEDSTGNIDKTSKNESPKEITISGTIYKLNGKSVQLYSSKSKSVSFSIPAKVNIGRKHYKVTQISPKAFKGNKKLKSVNMTANVSNIGSGAFDKCKNLKTVKVNGNVLKSVGKNAFRGTKKLTITVFAKNKKTYNAAVNKLKKSGGTAKKAKYIFKKKK